MLVQSMLVIIYIEVSCNNDVNWNSIKKRTHRRYLSSYNKDKTVL
jgi:hypothetical protein